MLPHPQAPEAAHVIRWRGLDIETTHRASAVLFTPQTGAVDLLENSSGYRVWLRSAAKPFQAVALLQHPNAHTLRPQDWAIASASHGGMPMHTAQVLHLLQLAQSNVGNLLCGRHLPLEDKAMRHLLGKGHTETALHHNCSGKHAGMLLACQWHDWDKTTYLSPGHPLQQMILNELSSVVDPETIHIGIDGCGVPVFSMLLADGATLFHHLASTPLYQPLILGMTRHPELVGDPQRIDTCLMQASGGDIVAKVGAEGLIGLAHLPSQTGMMIKIHDGLNAARDRLCLALVEQQGWLTPMALASLWAKPQFSTTTLNGRGDKTGHYSFNLT